MLPLVEITVRKGSLTDEQIAKFGEVIRDQVVKTFKEMKGTEPPVWVMFREIIGLTKT